MIQYILDNTHIYRYDTHVPEVYSELAHTVVQIFCGCITASVLYNTVDNSYGIAARK